MDIAYLEKLELQKEKSAQEYFKEQINDAITKLGNAEKYINTAKTELGKAYTGQVAKEKGKKLENEMQEIKSIVKELRQRVADINQTINSLN